MSDISSDSDDLCAKLSNEYDRFSVPDEFEDGWSREPAEMQDLKQICLEKMALDHVLKLHVDKVKGKLFQTDKKFYPQILDRFMKMIFYKHIVMKIQPTLKTKVEGRIQNDPKGGSVALLGG